MAWFFRSTGYCVKTANDKELRRTHSSLYVHQLVSSTSAEEAFRRRACTAAPSYVRTPVPTCTHRYMWIEMSVPVPPSGVS